MGNWIIETGLVVIVLLASVCVLFAAFYDVRQIRRLRTGPTANRRRPHVTVLVALRDQSDAVDNCLRSVRRTRYRRYDIVVYAASRVSADTKRAARNLVTKKTKVYIARKPVDEQTLVQRAFERSQRGEMVLLLEATHTIESSTLNQAVELLGRKDVTSVVMGRRIMPAIGFSEMIDAIYYLSQRMVQKALSAAKVGRATTLRSGRLYSSRLVKHPTGHRPEFDAQTIVNRTEDHEQLWQLALKLIASVSLLALILYAGWQAAYMQKPELLSLLWVVGVVWIGVTIWLDDMLPWRDRLGLTICLPIGCFVVAVGMTIRSSVKLLRRATF